MAKTGPKIEEILRQVFKPEHLEVEDDSAKHAGHAGARQGGGHYKVTLVAAAFDGKSLVEQHRLVNSALRDLFGSEIHALALQTYDPATWQKRLPPFGKGGSGGI
ncbi:MAG TPA: BolA family protein [bacterium]|nr:BolA family protein [bacterium]